MTTFAKLIKVKEEYALNRLYRVEGSPRLIMECTEFSLQYHSTWWEIRAGKRAHVLQHYLDKALEQAFYEDFNRNYTSYASGVRKNRIRFNQADDCYEFALTAVRDAPPA